MEGTHMMHPFLVELIKMVLRHLPTRILVAIANCVRGVGRTCDERSHFLPLARFQTPLLRNPFPPAPSNIRAVNFGFRRAPYGTARVVAHDVRGLQVASPTGEEMSLLSGIL